MTFGGGRIMVWGGMCGQERIPLVIVNGNLTAQIYIDHILCLTPYHFSSHCPTIGVTKAVVCGMMHVKEPLLLIRKSSPCGGSGFPLSLSEWSFTICHITVNKICRVRR